MPSIHEFIMQDRQFIHVTYVWRGTHQGAENKYASQSRHHALARHPRLQPVHLLTVVDKVRATLIYLRGENTVIRSSRHTLAECPAALYQQHVVPLPGGDGLRHLDAAVTEEQGLVGREQREGLVLLGLEEG